MPAWSPNTGSSGSPASRSRSTSPPNSVTGRRRCREADIILPTLAGPEIGVASTKAFTTQLAVLACVTLALARARATIPHTREAELVGFLTEIPSRASEVLNHDERIRQIA